MKRIKFRGKRLDNQEWECGGIIPVNVGLKVIAEEKWFIAGKHTGGMSKSYEHNILLTEVNPETVGQFTGLLDKNGTEIYEGDIVMWGHVNNYSKETPHRQAAVKLFPALHFETFTKTEFGTPHKFHYGNFAYRETHKHLEIIGNIHDNPELLKTNL